MSVFTVCVPVPPANGIIKCDQVESSMRAVDRKNYSPYNPYQDSPQSIGALTA